MDRDTEITLEALRYCVDKFIRFITIQRSTVILTRLLMMQMVVTEFK